MIVLSLFDGMSCGQIALQKLNIPITYYASEIDKFAIKVTKHNFPKTIHLGDIENWKSWDINWSEVSLLLGGSPCQGFSYAGRQLAFKDPRSKLFFTYVDILNHIKSLNPNVKFLLENVKMKSSYLDVISDFLKVEPKMYNSALVSAQRRIRYYWSNLPYPEIEDKGITVKDILDDNIDPNTIQGEGWHKWFKGKKDFQISKQYSEILEPEDRAITMTARQYASWNGNFVKMKQLGRGFNKGFEKEVTKTSTLSASSWQHNNFVEVKPNELNFMGGFQDGKTEDSEILYRKLSVKECCRLQTVPDYYFENSGVSSSQAYKMLGNGWTVDIIAAILGGLDG